MRITLTNAEIMQAATAGVMRELMNIREGQAPSTRGRDPENGWQLHIVGCLAEMAVAKATGRFWSGAHGDYGADDVGDLQVRASMRPGSRLIVHEYDDPAATFVFVRGGPVEFHIVGWIQARDAQQPGYWTDPGTGRPAYFVPSTVLRPIEELSLTSGV